MSYLVLARKWRPKTFDDLIGQEYITRTLKNAISTGKTAHALILSGPRGVGKTSTARIIAKALNCEKGPTTESCSVCSFCREISEGKSLDVLEIDAASHTGVNDIREIIENVRYVPNSGKTKVYIIDEAHMLSQSAFNALLKTLEEPPPHVLFIMATTESHKIPVTILSRCQRYNFKKVPTEKIKEKIKTVTSSEGIKIPEETLYLVAEEADGSMRDALSLLDQLIATFGAEIEHEDAARVLGISDKALIKSALGAIFARNPKRCIETLNEATEKGASPKRFAEDLLKLIRNALLIKVCGKESVSDLSDEEKKEIEKISAGVSAETVETLFKLMLEGAEEVQRSFYTQMALEATLVKLTLVSPAVPLDDILGRIEALSKKIGTGSLAFQQPRDPQKSPMETREKSVSYNEPPPANSFSAPVSAVSAADEIFPHSGEPADINTSGNSDTGDFVNYVRSKKPITAKGLEHADKVTADESTLRIEFFTSSIHSDHLLRQDAQRILKQFSKEFFNRDLTVKVELKSQSGAERDYPSPKLQNAKIKEEIYEEPIVQDALDIFGGKIVKIKTKEKE